MTQLTNEYDFLIYEYGIVSVIWMCVCMNACTFGMCVLLFECIWMCVCMNACTFGTYVLLYEYIWMYVCVNACTFCLCV